MRKHGPKTWSKNDGLGIHFGSQNRWKSMPERQKSAQIVKTCRFWKVPFFHRFFNAFFDEFWVSWASPGASKIDCSATFFDFFARLSLQSCSWGLLGPFRVDFSSIFRRFWHDFWSISSRFFVALLSVCCAFWVDFGSIIFDRTPPLWKKTLIRATKKEFDTLMY